MEGRRGWGKRDMLVFRSRRMMPEGASGSSRQKSHKYEASGRLQQQL
jgi:hypothetical protein